MNFEKETLAYDEIEINIKRLWQQCVKGIKWILLAGLIAAIALPAVKYVKDVSDYEAALAGAGAEEETELTEAELQAVERYILLRKQQMQYEVAKEESPIYKMDYENTYRGEVLYLIEAEDGTAGVVANLISAYFNGPQIEVDLADRFSFMKADYVVETSDMSATLIEDGKKPY